VSSGASLLSTRMVNTVNTRHVIAPRGKLAHYVLLLIGEELEGDGVRHGVLSAPRLAFNRGAVDQRIDADAIREDIARLDRGIAETAKYVAEHNPAKRMGLRPIYTSSSCLERQIDRVVTLMVATIALAPLPFSGWPLLRPMAEKPRPQRRRETNQVFASAA
jgi:hypothetical protein